MRTKKEIETEVKAGIEAETETETETMAELKIGAKTHPSVTDNRTWLSSHRIQYFVSNKDRREERGARSWCKSSIV
jgi:hypothetical protein